MTVAVKEKKNQVQVKQKTDYSRRVFALLALIGGYFEAYAIINRDGLFGNAQTSNYTHLWVSLCEGNIGDFIYHLLPIILYSTAIVMATVVPLVMEKYNWPKFCILFEMVSVVILGLLPSTIPYRFAILPIFFATALQYQTFQSCNGYVSSTIFCTNNIRQCVSAFTLYLMKKDKKYLNRSGFYLFNLFFFGIGVACVFVLSLMFGDKSIWFCLAPLVALCAIID